MLCDAARAIFCVFALLLAAAAASATRIEVTLSPAAASGPLTGRLIVVLAPKNDPEPRLTISPTGPPVIAIDVDHLAPGQTAVLDDAADAFPTRLAQVPAGDYFAQAVLNTYTQVHRSDGHALWVHINDGRIEAFQLAAGNLYGEARPVHLGDGNQTIRLELTHLIAPTPDPPDTQWVKHVRMQSKLLTAFWGQPVFIHATVLLPRGYDDHPSVRYPAIFPLGHSVPFSFSTDAERGNRSDRATTGLESGYEFYQAWNSDRFPRFVAITLQQATPYFPDSYSVNSANDGPYGDAFVQELLPFLEQRFRIIAQPYARILEGASTSGWQTLALTLQHPDVFGGAWVLQPDPIDFRHYQLTNIYKDDSAFVVPTGPATAGERPFRRSAEGQVVYTARDISRFEQVLGTHGRSGFQLEGWEAVYGPAGEDGYPRPLWNKMTGKIDHSVAAYMREHGFDLRDYAERNWPTLGPRLVGKLHFFCGDMDNFYLNLAVYDFEDFLKHTSNPHYEAEFTYGRPEKGHGWHNWTWAEMLRQMSAYIQKTAPPGENPAAWNY